MLLAAEKWRREWWKGDSRGLDRRLPLSTKRSSKSRAANHKPIYWLLSSSAQKKHLSHALLPPPRRFSLQEKQIADFFYTSAGQHFLSWMKKLSPVTAKTPDSAPECAPDPVDATAACCHLYREHKSTVLWWVMVGSCWDKQWGREATARPRTLPENHPGDVATFPPEKWKRRAEGLKGWAFFGSLCRHWKRSPGFCLPGQTETKEHGRDKASPLVWTGSGAVPKTSDVQNVCICTKSTVCDALSSQRLTVFLKVTGKRQLLVGWAALQGTLTSSPLASVQISAKKGECWAEKTQDRRDKKKWQSLQAH